MEDNSVMSRYDTVRVFEEAKMPLQLIPILYGISQEILLLGDFPKRKL